VLDKTFKNHKVRVEADKAWPYEIELKVGNVTVGTV